MQEGEVRKFISPPNLAYGDTRELAFIPPNSTLFFQIQLMKINVAPKPPEFKFNINLNPGFPDIPGVIRVLWEMATESAAAPSPSSSLTPSSN